MKEGYWIDSRVTESNTKHKNLKLLSAGFSFLFFLAGSLQQFMTVHFSTIGQENLGFNLLLTLYVTVFVSNIFAHKVINFIGKKHTLVFGTLGYIAAGLASCQSNVALLYLGFILMGGGCSLMWNAQNTLLIENSEQQNIGTNAGSFNMYMVSASLVGMLLFGWLLNFNQFEIVVFGFTLITCFSVIIFANLSVPKEPVKTVVSITQVVGNVKYVRASLVSALCFFLYGIAISFLPYQASLINADSFFIAIVSVSFLAIQAFAAKYLGNLLDKLGTAKMLVLAAALSAVGFGLMLVSLNVYMLVISSVILGLSSAILIPVSMALPKLVAP